MQAHRRFWSAGRGEKVLERRPRGEKVLERTWRGGGEGSGEPAEGSRGQDTGRRFWSAPWGRGRF